MHTARNKKKNKKSFLITIFPLFIIIILALLIGLSVKLNKKSPQIGENYLAYSSTSTSAKNWYVDNSASCSTCDGKSWNTAWKSFASIVWGGDKGVIAGDKIYISGGPSSKTYKETLTVKTSGSSGNFIKIEPGANSPSPLGHSGTVIIDGSSSRSSGIVIYGYNYIHVNGLSGSTKKIKLREHIGVSTGSVQVRNASYAYIDNLIVDNAKSRGVFLDNADHSRVNGCDIRTGTVNNNAQTDAIYMQFGNDNVIENNTVVLANADPDDHIDCLQIANQESRITIRNNWFEWLSGYGNNQSQGFITEDTTDWVRFYNNVVLGGSKNAYQAALFKEADSGVTYIWNNTIVSQHPSGIALKSNNMTDAKFGAIKNNILYAQNGYPIYLNTNLSSGKLDYNLLYRVSGTSISSLGGTSRSWAQHQAYGYDKNGLNVDPKLDKYNKYKLTSASSAINRATSLSTYFTTDIEGKSRTNPWDIGAYEYSGVSNTPLPPPNGEPL